MSCNGKRIRRKKSLLRNLAYPFPPLNDFWIPGKGDLVGCDITKHINGSDVIVKSSCDVKALTYCDLKCLNITGLVEVLKLYPEFQDQFAEDVKHDLTFNLREGYDADVSTIKYFDLSLHMTNEYTSPFSWRHHWRWSSWWVFLIFRRKLQYVLPNVACPWFYHLFTNLMIMLAWTKP